MNDRLVDTIQMNNEDLIKRSDAAEVVYKALKTPPLKGMLTDTMSLAIALVRDIPSADRPQGEWIDAEIPLECGGSMPIQVCNLCKTFYPLAYTGGGHRFCPNCGAKMKGAGDE